MNRSLLLVVVALPGFPSAVLADDHDRKSILVIGASTSISRHLAEALAEAGHHVYAGARQKCGPPPENRAEERRHPQAPPPPSPRYCSEPKAASWA